MKKIRNINIIFLLLIYIIDISSCIEEAPIEYDNLEYLETKTYILNIIKFILIYNSITNYKK